MPLDDAVAWQGELGLEENEEVINVTPTVTVDPRGGFLVADEREGQLRRYGTDGRLRWRAGTRGSGPGEYRSVARAIRLRDGGILAADRHRRMTVYDSAGTLRRTMETPFHHVEDLEPVSDSLVLVTGLLGRTGVAGPRLHVWDPVRNRVVRSFFRPFARQANPTAATIAGWSMAAVRGDTIAAIFALSDTIYLFSPAGRALGTVPLRFRRFRHVGGATPEGGSDPVRRARWLGTFDLVQNVHWLPDGRLLVAYQSLRPDEALTRVWHLFATDRAGRAVFESRDVPRLLTVDDRDGSLYFVSPGSGTPNRWSVARLRPSCC